MLGAVQVKYFTRHYTAFLSHVLSCQSFVHNKIQLGFAYDEHAHTFFNLKIEDRNSNVNFFLLHNFSAKALFVPCSVYDVNQGGKHTNQH